MNRVIYNAQGESKLHDDLAPVPVGWAESPADWGIETCPGVEPDPAILARAREMSAKQRGLTPLLSREEMLALAEQRGIDVDKRWRVERLQAALDGDGA